MLECDWLTGQTWLGSCANTPSHYVTSAMSGNTGNYNQQIVPQVFAYLRLKKHESNSNSFESLMYMNKERGLAKKVLWINHSHDTRNLLYRFPGSAACTPLRSQSNLIRTSRRRDSEPTFILLLSQLLLTLKPALKRNYATGKMATNCFGHFRLKTSNNLDRR